MLENTRYKLEGLAVRDLEKHVDERGFFAEILRNDWKELIHKDNVAQTSLSMSQPGVVRAWHRHARGQVDYIIVIEGTVRIAIYNDLSGSSTHGTVEDIIVSGEKLQAVRVPGHYWHGTKNIGDKPSLTLYFCTKLYNHADPDEERRPWNDSSIIDPRTNKPYDWEILPCKMP